MPRRFAATLLATAFAAASAPAQNNYTWASINQGGNLSYWNKFTNAQAWYFNNGPLSSGYPGFVYNGHPSSATDTATFQAWVDPDPDHNPVIPGSINPIINVNPGTGEAFYSFGTLTVDNTGPKGWMFLLDPATPSTITSLNLQSSQTALTITSNGSTNTTTFNNAFGVGNSQTWSLDGKTAFNAGVVLGANNLTISQLNSTTSTFAAGLSSTGGSLTVGGTGAVVITADSNGFGGITVQSSATLAGTATIAPGVNQSVSVAGTVAPGTGPNTVSTLTFGASGTTTSVAVTGTYAFDLTEAGTGGVAFNSGASGGTKDLLAVFGTLNLSGATVNINAVSGSTFNNTQSYSWLIASTSGGSLSGTPGLGTLGGDFVSLGGGQFSLNPLGNALFLNFTPVPEPGVVLATAAAGLGMVRLARRKNRSPVPSAEPGGVS